jgi:predicted nuclease of predicted toxin-antitoxin system
MFFLFDENVPYKFVQGLSLIEEANKKSIVEITHPHFLKTEGASDEEQIQMAGENNGIIISFDKDFKHIKGYFPLYKLHSVGVVFLKLRKDESNYWGIVKLIINQWENIKNTLKDKQKPFVYQVSRDGIQRFNF